MVESSLLISTLVILAIVFLVVIIFLVVLMKKKNVRQIVKKMVGEGKDIREILEYGRKKNWREREVKLYFFAHAVEDYLDRGFSLDQIKKMALKSGWPQDIVDIVLNKFGGAEK